MHDDDCGMVDAAPWLALAAGMSVGLLATTAWMIRTAWHLMGDVQARHFLGLP